MQRQLRRGGGIMNIAPREQFGLGSKLKRAVRKHTVIQQESIYMCATYLWLFIKTTPRNKALKVEGF